MYVWLAQSNYSFLQGASFPYEIVEAAAEFCFDGVCVCDFDGVYGLVQAYKGARQFKNLKVFYGVQFALNFRKEFREIFRGELETLSWQQMPVFLQDRLAFIATSKTSYGQIGRLTNYVHRNSKLAESLDLDDQEIPWPSEGLAILPARGVSQLFSPRQHVFFERWLKKVEQLRSRLPSSVHFALALTPPTSPYERNAFLNHLAAHKRLGVPLIATPDVFFHERSRKFLHDVVTAIRLNEPLTKVQWACFPNAERTFHKVEYYQRFFSKTTLFKQAMELNKSFAKFVNFSPSELKYYYPAEFIPPGHTAFSFLKFLVNEGLKERYGENPQQKVLDILSKEFALVEELNVADYFLTVWDVVAEARRRKILCQGRGSAANSAICFLLGVTGLDPLVSDVLFERFLSKERGEPPDIDVDFEHERREEVIQYIYTRYGRNRAAMVANLICYQSRGAVRATGKAFGLSDDKISEVLEVINDRSKRGRSLSELIQDGVAHQKETQEDLAFGPIAFSNLHGSLKDNVNVSLNEVSLEVWAATATLLRGFPRHLGIHSGGFVMSQEDLQNICPVEPATMPGRSVIQWNKEDLEYLGLFKVDFLSLGMLTAIRKTFSYLAAHNKRVPQSLCHYALNNVPSGCQKTYAMIGEAKTVGVFQIESRAQMSILPRLKPNRFYDLVVQVGIVRPGPIVSGMMHSYLRRRLKQEEVTYPDERLRPILERTLGVPLFQEQVMRIAIAVGNFSPGEADELRRAMGAWKMTGDMLKFRFKLKEGMRLNGIPEKFAEQIFKQIEGFAQYGFPESHATCFAHLVYVSSYLKAHYPAYFLCGLLNSQPLGFYSVHSLVQEAQREGVKVIPPCVLRSQWDSHVTKKGEVQLGLRILSSIQKEHVEEFLAAREKFKEGLSLGEVFSIWQCFSAPEKIHLVMANCFRNFDSNRRNILWHVLAQPSSLLPDVKERYFSERQGLLEAWDNMQDDFRNMKTSFGDHPVSLLKEISWPFDVPQENILTAKEILEIPDKKVVTVCGMTIVRQSPPTAKGFIFLTLEDEVGSLNIIVKPAVFERYKNEVLYQDIICVRGMRQANGSQCVVIAKEFFSYRTGEKVALNFERRYFY